MFAKNRLARTFIATMMLCALILSFSTKPGLAQETPKDLPNSGGPIIPPPASKNSGTAPKSSMARGKSTTDPAGFGAGVAQLPQKIQPQVGFLSSGYRSLHFNRSYTNSFAWAFLVTIENDYIYVSDWSGYMVKMSQITAGGVSHIRTFGTGTSGTGPGQFGSVGQVAVVGNDVFVADIGNNRIQRFDKATGVYVSQFGATGSAAGQFNGPSGLVYNPIDGFLYVSEIGNNRIQKFNTTGIYQGQFGSPGSGNGQLSNPWSLAVDSLGNIYAADTSNNRVVKFASTGTFIRNIGSGLSFPYAVTVDGANNVWITSSGNNNVYAYDWQGNYRMYYYGENATAEAGYFTNVRGIGVTKPLTFAPYNGSPAIVIADAGSGNVQLFSPSVQPSDHPVIDNIAGITGSIYGVAFDSAENIFVAAFSQNRIYKFDKFGGLLTFWGTAGTGNGQFNSPFGITVDDSDNVYVSDRNNHRIQKFNSAGTYITQWGTLGTGDGQFNSPGGIATDGSWLYVTDEVNDRVQKFSLTGTYVRQWGGTGTGNGQMDNPAGIAVDRKRNQVYVVEYFNSRVQQFTVFGDFIKVFSGATLSFPVGMTTDQQGNIYIADRGNNRIIQYNDNGTYLTTFASTSPNIVAVNPKNAQIYVGANSGGTLTHYGSPTGKFDTIGVWRPSTQTFMLRNGLTAGAPDITATVQFAQSTDLPIVGDWNGDGYDTPGLYRPGTSFFYLWDKWLSPSMGAPDYLVLLGNPGDQGIAGDWDGNGRDGVGTFRPSNGILYLKNDLTTGVSEYDMVLGNPSDRGIAGDWNLDGAGNAGIFRPSEARFYLTNRNWHGIVFDDGAYFLGFGTDLPFTGDWTHSAYSGIAVFRPSTGTMYLKYNLDAAPADLSVAFGASGDIPLAGLWGTIPTVADAGSQAIKPFTVPPNVVVAPGSSGVNPADVGNAD